MQMYAMFQTFEHAGREVIRDPHPPIPPPFIPVISLCIPLLPVLGRMLAQVRTLARTLVLLGQEHTPFHPHTAFQGMGEIFR